MKQERRDVVRIEIVPGRAFASSDAAPIRARFVELAGEPIDVRVDVVHAFERTAAGKHRPIRSLVSQP